MTAGRVAVNGVTTTELGAKVDPLVDIVTVDGRPVSIAEQPTYLVLHKPRGVMTTMSDPQGRPTVASLVPLTDNPGLFPVGRLDFDTTGLLLFTTDGELAHRLLHPKWKVPKTYRAVVDGIPDDTDLGRLRTGIELDDGPTAPAQVFVLERRGTNAVVEITITEGRKRQVRRMFSRVSHPVIDLERVSFGPVGMTDLEPGAWRDLSSTEVAALRKAAGMSGEAR